MNQLVSVIIPVYNVEEYLDECLESVVNQTYKNLEIVIVNDGSTDNSEKICKKWAEKDSRIKYYKKENEGLGPTRNYGIKKATGEWVAFIDSDDWYDLTFIEKMLKIAIDNNAEVVSCNLKKVDFKTGNISKMNRSSIIGIPLSREKALNNIMGVCTKISKKSLWFEYNIWFPNTYGEDFAVVMPLLLASKKYINIEEYLYFYRKGRPGSISSNGKSNRIRTVNAAEYLVNKLKENNNFFQNNKIVKEHILNNFELILSSAWNVENELDYQNVKKDFLEFMYSNFEGFENKNIIHIGSYNLMRILRHMPYLQDTNLSFQFSGIISIMNEAKWDIPENHKNLFRKKMIDRDIKSEFIKKIYNEKIDYLVLDLIEERFDILKYNNGYFTKSNAFDDLNIDINFCEIITYGSEIWWELWKESLNKFFEFMSNNLLFSKIIVVENYLCETYGDIQKEYEYEEIVRIQKTNDTLRKCYSYIKNNYSEIKFVEAYKVEYYFTDIEYEYGAYPWHLNEMANENIAQMIECQL